MAFLGTNPLSTTSSTFLNSFLLKLRLYSETFVFLVQKHTSCPIPSLTLKENTSLSYVVKSTHDVLSHSLMNYSKK